MGDFDEMLNNRREEQAAIDRVASSHLEELTRQRREAEASLVPFTRAFIGKLQAWH
jgi:hypothetical protein